MTERRLPEVAIRLAIGGCVCLAGCGTDLDLNDRYTTFERVAKGMVIILPGIEGKSPANVDIRNGLAAGGVPYALTIYRWGFPIPGIGMVVNQTNVLGNRAAARHLAELIVAYQRGHPGRPIFLAGHSAGAGMAVFTLEALGDLEAEPIDGAVLLSPSLSATYKLDKALPMASRGIVCFYNPDDRVLLQAGTTLMGNVDGGRGAAAGRTGFVGRYPKLFQRKLSAGDLRVPATPHFVSSQSSVVASEVAPWVNSRTWPPVSTGRGVKRRSGHARGGRVVRAFKEISQATGG